MSNDHRIPWVSKGLLLAWSMIMVWVPVAAAYHWPPSAIVSAVALAFVCYGGILLRPDLRDAPPFFVCGMILIVGAAMVLAPPVLSDDVFRFLWDGRVSLSGIDPYAHAPNSPALAHLRDEVWTHVNHPQIPTVYPPLGQVVFAAGDLVLHHPATFKAIALAAHLGVTFALFRSDARVAIAFGLNPLALVESALGGHLDILVGAAVLAFALWLRDGRHLRAGAAAFAAIGLKLVGALLLPLLLFRRFRVFAVVALLGLVVLLPVSRAGYADEEVSGLSHYAGRWEGNAGPYRWLDGAMQGALDASFGVAPGRIRIAALESVLVAVEGTVVDPWRAFEREKKPVVRRSVMPTHVLSAYLTRLCLLLGLFGLALWMARRKTPVLTATRTLVFGALLCAPQVHPWYLLWLLPLEAYMGRRSALIWSSVILVAYVPLDGWLAARVWSESAWATNAQYLLVLLALAFEWRSSSRREPKDGNHVDPKELPRPALVSTT